MKIDKWDKKILTNLYKNSRATLSELSKKVGLPKENIHYRIKRFEKENLINYIPYVNLSKLGYDYFLVRIKLDPLSENYTKFIKDLTKEKKTIWLSEDKLFRATDYNIIAIILHNNFSKIQDHLTVLVETAIIEKFELSLIRTLGFAYRDIYTAEELFECYLKTGAHRFEKETDQTDTTLVLKLLENSRSSLTELGTKLRLSPLTIKNRIGKLKEKDIINHFTISLNFNKLEGKFVALSYSAERQMATKKARKIVSKYFSEVMTVSPFFTQKRILFGRVENEEKFLKAMSEINKVKGINISASYENTQILKNKIF